MAFNDKQIQIMVTAEQLFADKSFDGTSVRDIAEGAGVNIAMISYYFGSKEKLLESLFMYRSETSASILETLLNNKNETSIQKINTLIDYYIDKIQGQPCFHKIMMREEIASFRPTTSAMITEFKKRNLALIKQLVQQGQKNGEFKKNIDVTMMMGTLIGTVSYMVSTQHHYKNINDLESLSDEELKKTLKKHLSTHLKTLFKAILTHEA